MSVRPEVRERLTAHAAGWYAGDDPYSSYYGAPLRLGGGARRFDVSPAWVSWASTAPNRFRDGLGLPAGDSAIVSAELPEAEERLRGTRVMAAARSGLLRTSWHVYNTDEDVDELLPRDMAGNPRIVDGLNTGTEVVDIGAFEYQPP